MSPMNSFALDVDSDAEFGVMSDMETHEHVVVRVERGDKGLNVSPVTAPMSSYADAWGLADAMNQEGA